MDAQQIKHYTVEDFDRIAALPENADKLLEFIGGEIIEVPSNAYSSEIAAHILIMVGLYVKTNKLGHITGEQGGYMVSGERYAPDVAYLAKSRQAQLAKEGYNPTPPDLAVEVVSPSDSSKLITVKVGNYLAAGTVVWVVYPEIKEVAVYVPGQPVKIITADGTLDGSPVLPGFTLPMKEIFPD